MGSGEQVSCGQVSGIAGGSEQFSAGVSGLVKKPLDCTVGKLIVYTHAPASFTVLSVVHNFKHHLQNRLPNQSQILC